MNNTPAFPHTWLDPQLRSSVVAKGMTLRDYFAAKALQNFRDQIGSQSDQEWFDKMAKGAYRVADAMMAARSAT